VASEIKLFIAILIVFLIFYFVPFDLPIVSESILNGFKMLNEYAREHVLLCLVPAFFIAGTISVMLKKDAILKLLGPDVNDTFPIRLLQSVAPFLLCVPVQFFHSLVVYTKKVLE